MRTFKTYADMNKSPEVGDLITTAVGATISMGMVVSNGFKGVEVKFLHHDNPVMANGGTHFFPEIGLANTYGPMVEDNMDMGHRDPEYLIDLEDAFERFEYEMDIDPDQDDHKLTERLSLEWGVGFNDLANRIIKSRYS
jgi:hypothetical protein